jgi:hypothetical protein
VKTLDQMTPDELMLEASKLRVSISASAIRLMAIYDLLHRNVRRRSSDDMTSAYLSVANVGRRLSGMILQGVRRASSMDKVVVATRSTLEEKIRRDTELKDRAAQKHAKQEREQQDSDRHRFAKLMESYEGDSEQEATKLPVLSPEVFSELYGD